MTMQDDVTQLIADIATLNTTITSWLGQYEDRIAIKEAEVDAAIAAIPAQVSGDWTPDFSSTGGASGQVYSNVSGKFIKDEKRVDAWGEATYSAKGTHFGYPVIGNLPFPVDPAVLFGGGSVGEWSGFAAGVTGLHLSVYTQTTVRIRGDGDGADSALGTNGQSLTDTSSIKFHITYYTNA